ncbi:MAG: flagella basal body P-ring formation protein FlgA [Bryobacteraceae bacterium]|nr:flagella basal body P-ring formation protein FlgA [Bryobacteraceae bacterium]
MILLSLLVAGLPFASGACVQVRGDRILAREIALLAPAFGAKPEADLGPAPLPGIRRHLSPAELTRMAARAGVEAGAEAGPEAGICLERESWRLSAEVLLPVLQMSLANASEAETDVEIIDFSRYQLPHGELAFRPEWLLTRAGQVPDRPVLWRGVVRTGGGRSTPVWAKVRVTAAQKLVRAARTVPAGKPEVAAGQKTEIEVRSGAVRLKLSGVAERQAGMGEAVAVRTAIGKKRFRGIVIGKGLVQVDADHENPDVDPALESGGAAAGSAAGGSAVAQGR